MSLSRAFQWVGVAVALLVLVGLNYEFESKAGMQMNAAPESPLSQSLRGYWKLDDGSGTNATDSSGNANTLAMTGSPSWVAGQIGPSALDFSGSGQYLSVADPSSGVLDSADGEDFTISGWFNRDTFANDHTIVAKRNSQSTNTDAGYIIWVDDATDTLNATVGDGGGTASDQYTAAGTTAITATGWHHFSIVWDDSNGLFIYLDGKLDGSTTSSTTSINDLSNALAFTIGAESDAGVPFDGKIDDIRIYGYALSADQVKKLYNTTSPAQPVDTSLVGHWTFDGADIQGTTAIDRSSFGNNGTITGTTKTIGKLGQALSFNGSSDYISVTDPGSGSTLDFGNSASLSLSMWVYPTALSSEASLISKDTQADCGYNTNYTVYYYNGGDYGGCTASACPLWFDYVASGVSNHKYYTQDQVITLNTWRHIIITYTFGTGSSMKMYVDGQLQTGEWYFGTGNGSPVTSDQPIWIGASNYCGGLSVDIPFTGRIDDVRIYNRALSATEIANLYNMGR